MILDKDLHAKLCTGNLENMCLRICLNSGLQIFPIAQQDFEILDLRIFRREEQKNSSDIGSKQSTNIKRYHMYIRENVCIPLKFNYLLIKHIII